MPFLPESLVPNLLALQSFKDSRQSWWHTTGLVQCEPLLRNHTQLSTVEVHISSLTVSAGTGLLDLHLKSSDELRNCLCEGAGSEGFVVVYEGGDGGVEGRNLAAIAVESAEMNVDQGFEGGTVIREG